MHSAASQTTDSQNAPLHARNGAGDHVDTDPAVAIAPYWLARHVFLALSEHQVILLDLKHDRYLALDASRAQALAGLVHGWPTSLALVGGTRTAPGPEAPAIARRMAERQLLTTDASLGKDATPLGAAPPSATLLQPPALEESLETTVKIHAHHVIVMLATSLMAAVSLKWRSLERIVTQVARRRHQHVCGGGAFDHTKARVLVEIFYRLRPFVFTARNACLFDSLALIHFLSRYGLFPQWVFGVRGSPFSAHCWVQADDTVLNGSIEHTAVYTPIMVV